MKGKNGSDKTAKADAICNATYIWVCTLAGFSFTIFQGSSSAKYLFPKEHAEVYFEYGRNDRGATPINIFYDSVATGYVGGVRKLFLLPNSQKYGAISLNIEVVQLKMPQANLIWNANLLSKQSSWYTNSQVRQGYTNRGQILGSNVGPGGSGQTMQLAWVKGINKIGIKI